MKTVSIKTSQGEFQARFSDNGLAGIDFPRSKANSKESSRQEKAQSIPQSWLNETRNAVTSMLAGEAPKKLPPLDFSTGTKFQQAVWRVLSRIPTGQTMTYGEVAESVGSPKGFRAVGRACGANPIPLLVPCHRVLAANRRIGGFSGGLGWKQKLLAIEGVAVAA